MYREGPTKFGLSRKMLESRLRASFFKCLFRVGSETASMNKFICLCAQAQAFDCQIDGYCKQDNRALLGLNMLTVALTGTL